MEKITDELLFKYVPIVDDILIKEIEEQTNYEYKFSDDFEKKMKKLIFQEKHHNLYKFLRSPLKMVASIVIVIVLSIFTVTMSVEARRLLFFEKMQEIWEDSFLYKYYMEQTSESIFFEPDFIVEGYELKNYTANDIAAVYEYYNSDTNQQYNISQELVTDGKKVIFDSSFDFKETIAVGELIVDVYRYDNGYVRAYAEYNQYIFNVDADDLTNKELKEILENWIR